MNTFFQIRKKVDFAKKYIKKREVCMNKPPFWVENVNYNYPKAALLKPVTIRSLSKDFT